MKDVTNYDMLRVAVSKLLSGDFRMGEPTSGNALVSYNESIVVVRATQ